MKRWLIYILLPIMLLQSNMTLVICTSFYYNQNFIEKYLCVQRNMQNNTCHGQCYLMKKLKNQQEKEQKNFKINLHESFIISAEYFCFDITETLFITKKYNLYSDPFQPKDFIQSVDRPPLFG